MNLQISRFTWIKKSMGWAAPFIAAFAIAGCGGGGDSNPPTLSSILVTTAPAAVTYQGGTANLSLMAIDSTGVDSSTVKVNVLVGGASVSGGPVVMTKSATPNVYTYSTPLANNITGTSAVTYNFQVTAADLQGHALLAPVNAGSVSVPAPPGPPSGP